MKDKYVLSVELFCIRTRESSLGPESPVCCCLVELDVEAVSASVCSTEKMGCWPLLGITSSSYKLASVSGQKAKARHQNRVQNLSPRRLTEVSIPSQERSLVPDGIVASAMGTFDSKDVILV